jgi:SAM-dependent methyltransferase
MIARARHCHPAHRFDVADAEALPFPDDSFDAVTFNLAIQDITQPNLALAEAFRVLRPGGRIGLTAWATGNTDFDRALSRFAAPTAEGPVAPAVEGFSDEPSIRGALVAAGFPDPAIVELPLVRWLLSDYEDFLRYYQRDMEGATEPGTPPPALREWLEQGLDSYAQRGGWALPCVVMLASAYKPAAKTAA